MSEKPITWAVHTVNSRCDMYGNCYWFATYTCIRTGKSKTYKVSARSNAEYIGRRLAGDNAQCLRTTSELFIREWNRQAKGLPYLNDCDEIEATSIIRKELE